jgi:hypothetical protein
MNEQISGMKKKDYLKNWQSLKCFMSEVVMETETRQHLLHHLRFLIHQLGVDTGEEIATLP